jgi:hypothetical protein
LPSLTDPSVKERDHSLPKAITANLYILRRLQIKFANIKENVSCGSLPFLKEVLALDKQLMALDNFSKPFDCSSQSRKEVLVNNRCFCGLYCEAQAEFIRKFHVFEFVILPKLK